MLNEIKAAADFDIEKMKGLLMNNQEPRLRHATLKTGANVVTILTLTARKTLYPSGNVKPSEERIQTAYDTVKKTHEALYDLTAGWDGTRESTFLEYFYSFSKANKDPKLTADQFRKYSDKIKGGKFTPSTDAFSSYGNSYSYNSILASAIDAGPLENYRVKIDKDLFLRIKTHGSIRKESKKFIGKNDSYYLLYLIVEMCKSLYLRYGDQYYEHIGKKESFIPVLASNLQNDLGVSNVDHFLNNIPFFYLDEEPMFRKLTLSNSRCKILINKKLFIKKDGSTCYPVFSVEDITDKDPQYFILEEKDGDTPETYTAAMQNELDGFYNAFRSQLKQKLPTVRSYAVTGRTYLTQIKQNIVKYNKAKGLDTKKKYETGVSNALTNLLKLEANLKKYAEETGEEDDYIKVSAFAAEASLLAEIENIQPASEDGSGDGR